MDHSRHNPQSVGADPAVSDGIGQSSPAAGRCPKRGDTAALLSPGRERSVRPTRRYCRGTVPPRAMCRSRSTLPTASMPATSTRWPLLLVAVGLAIWHHANGGCGLLIFVRRAAYRDDLSPSFSLVAGCRAREVDVTPTKTKTSRCGFGARRSVPPAGSIAISSGSGCARRVALGALAALNGAPRVLLSGGGFRVRALPRSALATAGMLLIASAACTVADVIDRGTGPVIDRSTSTLQRPFPDSCGGRAN